VVLADSLLNNSGSVVWQGVRMNTRYERTKAKLINQRNTAITKLKVPYRRRLLSIINNRNGIP